MAECKVQNEKKILSGICATCVNADNCEFIKPEHEAVWECELFMAKGEKGNKPVFSE